MAEITAYPLKLVKGLRVYQGTLTADYQGVDLTATWNAGATTFSLIKANVTNTASAAASKLIDLQVGGVSQFSVTRAGVTALTGSLAIGGALTGATAISVAGAITSTAVSGALLTNNTGGTGNMHFRLNNGGSDTRYGVESSVGGTVFAGTTAYATVLGTQQNLPVEVVSNNGVVARFDASATATHTRLLIYDVDNGQLERVTVGAADSGGAGFKVLRIAN